MNANQVFEIETLGGRHLCIEQRARGRKYLERAEGSAVGNALWCRHRLERHLCCNYSAVAAEVGWPLALGRVIAQVDDHLGFIDVY
ncbi:hypothetical protein D3C81_1633470 [compost metagenome]